MPAASSLALCKREPLASLVIDCERVSRAFDVELDIPGREEKEKPEPAIRDSFRKLEPTVLFYSCSDTQGWAFP
jgi:hypothetical protein